TQLSYRRRPATGIHNKFPVPDSARLSWAVSQSYPVPTTVYPHSERRFTLTTRHRRSFDDFETKTNPQRISFDSAICDGRITTTWSSRIGQQTAAAEHPYRNQTLWTLECRLNMPVQTPKSLRDRRGLRRNRSLERC